MSRLVVISNRVALPNEDRAGGLAVALRAALEERGGLWFGWSGARARESVSTEVHTQEVGRITYTTLDLSRAEYDGYYSGFSNRTLWPLLHFRLDLVEYSRQNLDAYLRVNARFADALAPRLQEDDIVWVHDYHLFPFGAMLRERGFGGRIGFFLHVPMPSSDMLAALPGHETLFGNLSAYDLVGLHTRRDVERLQDYMRLYRGAAVHNDVGEIRLPERRRFRVGAFPISIDTALIERQAAEAMRRPAVRRLRASLSGRRLAIGVDRLDYSKGLTRRFRAYERYLETREGGDALTFLQIAPPTRSDVAEYQQLRARLEGLAGHINGRHAQADWTPVRYVNRNFSHDVLTGFYRSAAVGLVTPQRDGMNLVAKEFVASQDPADPGVLVLSRFAGAAYELTEALLVNPYDIDGVAEAIMRAENMPLSERRERHAAMLQTLRRHDINAWRSSFLEALAAA
jgi:trehalose 6-phosphate synthase